MDEPVLSKFGRAILLTDDSNEYELEMEERIPPAETATRRVPRPPCPARHRTDVSDSHSVPSHPVCPDRTIAVTAVSPTPAPCTVTDADPVPARLYPSITLSLPVSMDSPMLPVPDRSPAVIVTRRLPEADRPIAVSATSPRPAPCTVTDADPVPALFSRRITLIHPMSTEYPSDMLPDRSPAVMATRRVPRAP